MDCCVPGSNCFEWIKALSPAFVALVIGGIAAYIALRQYKVAEAKLNLDLFERRYKIFEQVWKTVSDTFSYGPKDQKLFGEVGLGRLGTPFNFYSPEAGFLFGKEVQTYIHELAKKWAQFHALEGKTTEGMTNEEAAKHHLTVIDL